MSTVLLSYVVLGEPFSWAHPAGVRCVLLTILLIACDRPAGEEDAAGA